MGSLDRNAGPGATQLGRTWRVVRGRRITRRGLAAGATVGGVLAGTLAGCTAPSQPAKPSLAPAAIRYVYRAGYELVFEEFARRFMQKMPQVSVTTETYPGSDYFTKLDVLLASNSIGDVVWVSSSEAYFDHIPRGSWLAIDQYAKRDRLDHRARAPNRCVKG